MNHIKLPYMNRKKFCRKVREAELEVQRLKGSGDWWGASHLQLLLRNIWWGYKRYENL